MKILVNFTNLSRGNYGIVCLTKMDFYKRLPIILSYEQFENTTLVFKQSCRDRK